MDMVTRQRTALLAITLLLGMLVSAHADVEQNEPARGETSATNERQEESDERKNAKGRDDEKEKEEEDEEEAMSESKKDAVEQDETYTRLPVQTRINPNQNVDLPQDI